MESKFKILLINDNSEDVQKIQSVLCDLAKTLITLEVAETPLDGLKRALKGGIDLILLDLSRSEIQGFEALKEFRARLIILPVIVMIGIDNEELGVLAMKEGAQDYLCKNNIDRESLRHSIRYAMERCKMAEELKIANRKILEQQESVIEEASLKSLLEQTQSTAHELNQPLTALLGTIYLMKMNQDNAENISQHMERIESSGKRISTIVQKIQTICYEKKKHYLGGASIIEPEQKVKHNIEAADNNFKNLNNLFRIIQSRYNRTDA